MLKEFVDRIIDLASPETIEIDHLSYSKDKLQLVRMEQPDPLKTATLASLVDYLKAQLDYLSEPGSSLFIHIVSPTRVDILDEVAPDMGRGRPVTAEATAVKVTESPLPQDKFLTMIQQLFVDDDECRRLLALCGNVTAERVNSSADDGVSQTVSKKAGVHTLAKETVKNPWRLRPFRTFREIFQPWASYVLRIHYSDDQALFSLSETADEGWKLDAVRGIKTWLTEAFEKAGHPLPVILA